MIRLGSYVYNERTNGAEHPEGSPFEVPDDLATQASAVIARRGWGKTYFATLAIEALLRTEAQVIAIDPVGVWWGLAYKPDGARSDLPIHVFGGEHADVPIQGDQGAQVAQLVVERGVNAVIDVSGFGSKAAWKRFVADFVEELYHLAKKGANRRPRTLVLEEAQTFAPQNPQSGEERMLGAITLWVRLGRNFSGGAMLLTQRPQSVSKEVLNQCELLVLGQLVGAHERKAVSDWVVENAEADTKQARAWLAELPSLPRGVAWIWSPAWLGSFTKVAIGQKATMDTSATIKVGASNARGHSDTAITLSREHLASARDLISALNALTTAPEPDSPGKRVAKKRTNERQAAMVIGAALGQSAGDVALIAQLRTTNEDLNAENRRLAMLVATMREAVAHVRSELGGFDDTLRVAYQVTQRLPDAPERKAHEAAAAAMTSVATKRRDGFYNKGYEAVAAAVDDLDRAKREVARAKRPKPAPGGACIDGMNAQQQKIVETLAALHPLPFTLPQLAKAVGVHQRSKGYANNLGWLNSHGYIDKGLGTVRLGEKALRSSLKYRQKITNGLVREFWEPRLSGMERRILERVAYASDKQGGGIAVDLVAEALDTHPRTKSFQNALGALRGAGLVTKGATVALTPYMLGKGT